MPRAIDYYRLALAESRQAPGFADPATLCALHEGLGDMLALTGRQAEAREAYAAALTAGAPDEAVRMATLHRKVGRTWETHHQHAEALRSHDQALVALGQAPASEDARWWEALIQGAPGTACWSTTDAAPPT